MARISVKQPDVIIPKTRANDIFSLACLASLHYPMHSPDEYMNMPMKRLKTMLGVAERQEATRYANLLNIAAAPHTEKPDRAIAKLMGVYKEMARG